MNRVLTKRDREVIRVICNRCASATGLDPNVLHTAFSFLRTTLDLRLMQIFLQKKCEEAELKGAAPDALMSSVISDD